MTVYYKAVISELQLQSTQLASIVFVYLSSLLKSFDTFEARENDAMQYGQMIKKFVLQLLGHGFDLPACYLGHMSFLVALGWWVLVNEIIVRWIMM